MGLWVKGQVFLRGDFPHCKCMVILRDFPMTTSVGTKIGHSGTEMMADFRWWMDVDCGLVKESLVDG